MVEVKDLKNKIVLTDEFGLNIMFPKGNEK